MFAAASFTCKKSMQLNVDYEWIKICCSYNFIKDLFDIFIRFIVNLVVMEFFV